MFGLLCVLHIWFAWINEEYSVMLTIQCLTEPLYLSHEGSIVIQTQFMLKHILLLDLDGKKREF